MWWIARAAAAGQEISMPRGDSLPWLDADGFLLWLGGRAGDRPPATPSPLGRPGADLAVCPCVPAGSVLL